MLVPLLLSQSRGFLPSVASNSLHVTHEAACAQGCFMGAMVAKERHLWQNLSDMNHLTGHFFWTPPVPIGKPRGWERFLILALATPAMQFLYEPLESVALKFLTFKNALLWLLLHFKMSVLFPYQKLVYLGK